MYQASLKKVIFFSVSANTKEAPHITGGSAALYFKNSVIKRTPVLARSPFST
jgi:hypothetical protein